LEADVLKLVARVKGWWQAGRPDENAPVPYAVACQCGHTIEGFRQPMHQVVPCPKCNTRIFVLPQSPLPRILNLQGKRTRRAPRVGRKRVAWLFGLAFIVAGLTGLLVLWLIFGRPKSLDDAPLATEETETVLQRAQTSLARGNYRTAVEALDRAQAILDQRSGAPAERRRLSQLRRQAALAADLLEVPLQEVVRHAQELAPGEWQSVFNERYRGKAVLFDAEVGRADSGKLVLDYLLIAGRQEARIEITDLEILQHVHVDQPTRLILGARLAGIVRRAPGPWVIHLQPASGVLMTDRSILVATCPILSSDGSLPALLERQSNWLERER
jgi:hypothetical protein